MFTQMKYVRHWLRRVCRRLMRRRRFVDGYLVHTPTTVQELTDAVYAHFATDSHPFYVASMSPGLWDELDELSGKGWNVRLEADSFGDLFHVIYSVDTVHIKTILRKNDRYDN